MSRSLYMDSDSDSSSTEEHAGFNDPSKLVPYSFEPLVTSSDNDEESEAEHESEDPSNSSRVGNTEWCQCSQCKLTDTYIECLCCREADEIHEDLFEGKQYTYSIVLVQCEYKLDSSSCQKLTSQTKIKNSFARLNSNKAISL